MEQIYNYNVECVYLNLRVKSINFNYLVICFFFKFFLLRKMVKNTVILLLQLLYKMNNGIVYYPFRYKVNYKKFLAAVSIKNVTKRSASKQVDHFSQINFRETGNRLWEISYTGFSIFNSENITAQYAFNMQKGYF